MEELENPSLTAQFTTGAPPPSRWCSLAWPQLLLLLTSCACLGREQLLLLSCVLRWRMANCCHGREPEVLAMLAQMPL